MAEVIVVGAGLIGLGIAYELAKLGISVAVYDRGEPAGAASWAGAGMLAPFSEDIRDQAMLALCRESLAMYPGFVEELTERTGIDARLRREGTLHVAIDDARLAALVALAPVFHANGAEVAILDRRDVLAREPMLTKVLSGGLLIGNESQIDNRRLGRALFVACQTLGVSFERVDGITLECDSRRVRGLRTAYGFTSAPFVVNASGAWAGVLPGVPAGVRVRVRPIAGQMLAIAIPRAAMRTVVWFRHRYLVPRSNGHLLVGATVEESGFNARVTASGVHDLLDAVLTVAPSVASFAVIETWAGLRPASHDGRPYLGATPLTGYVVACGHYRNGILLTPITARSVADVIMNRCHPRLESFSPTREQSEQNLVNDAANLLHV